MGVRKNGGREEDTRVLSCVLSCASSLLPITFKRVKCSNLLLCIMINSPAPLLSARSLHTALFPLVHYFLYTRGKCVTLKATIRAVHKTLRRRDSTPPTLHHFFRQSFAREELCSRPPRGNCCICFENKMAVWEVYQY